MSYISPSIRNKVIKDAQDVPGLVSLAKAQDPTLFKLLVGSHTKNAWWPIVSGVVAWAVTTYGLGWDTNTCDAVTGAVITAGMALYHYLAPKLVAPDQGPVK